MELPKKKKILMITGDFNEDYEVMVPYQIFTLAGHEVSIVSPGKKKGDKIKTAVHDASEEEQQFTERRGHNVTLTYDFDSVKPDQFDGLYLPGGRAPEFLRLNSKVVEIAKYFLDNNKPTASICHGIQILVATKSLKDKYVTCYEGASPEVKLAGGHYTKLESENVTSDGNLVTGVDYKGHPALLKLFLSKLETGFCKKAPL